MGVVYKAEDTKLKRTVALKFLPPHLTRDNEAKQRFIQEAQAASALQHSNICTIHDIDESDAGSLFIVMDCYEGETLKNKMVNCQLSIDNCLEIVTQVGQGLQKAHEKRIVHRDIKPANIMVTNDGVVKILDFGLAKLAGQGRFTRTGSTVGTAAYMSPEQARGQEVDHRTDIWSLGVVLFEMLTGKLPFQGDHEAAMLYSIVHEEPGQVLEHRLDIPVGLALTVSKALQKEPNERYQSMQEFINDLKGASSPVVQLPKQEKSIVVLPFENLSPDPDQEYFSDGLTEEVISDLSNVRALRVISRSSAMTFKATKKKIPDVAHELNVQYVLEGSVRKAGNDVRITAQLIDARNDAHLWAQKFSGTLEDVFDIQEKVSRSIVDALRLKLNPHEEQQLAARPIGNPVAYDSYLRATREIYLYTEDGFDRALQYLQMAQQVVGENALLYAGMGVVYVEYYNTGLRPGEETLQRAEDFARKALALEPNGAHCYHLLGLIERHKGHVKNAIRNFKHACDLDPNDPQSLGWLGYYVGTFAGRPKWAEPYLKRLTEVDPLTPLNYFFHAMAHAGEGSFDLAVAAQRTYSQAHKTNRWALAMLAHFLALGGQAQEAIDLGEQLVKADSQDAVASFCLFIKYSLERDTENALSILNDQTRKFWWNDPEMPWFAAGYFALMGEKDMALVWLERAIEREWMNYPLFAHIDPHLATIRGEERFKKLMERVKREWEEFEL